MHHGRGPGAVVGVAARDGEGERADGVGKKPGRPSTWARRQLIDGIRFRVRTGVPWRDVPEEHGPWGRVYDPFRRRQRNGTWQRMFTQIQARADAQNLIAGNLNVDATVCRAHQHAAGARRRGTCRRNRPAASPPSPVSTASGARAAA
ncbi:transposase [Streptomyces sp. NBC_01433]|uniref:transposase n=1 Tax=Streptomyces sp. NBC_01433 TaxID=2903864 RepID=UPI0022586715|nr:transposase [Streptomyces sp. NBC_01433]MCX4679307.1 transposase [Streptomyces sp. NBC_01433]